MLGKDTVNSTSIARTAVEDGSACLGIEFGSTRIKAVLIGKDFLPIATGGHEWRATLADGVWTYSLDDVWAGVQAAFADLAANVRDPVGCSSRSAPGRTP